MQTKQMRHEKQLVRDEIEDMTEQLDEKWRKLMASGAINNLAQKNANKANKSTNQSSDYYDRLV